MLRPLLALSCAAVAAAATVAAAQPAPADDDALIARVVADLPGTIVTLPISARP